MRILTFCFVCLLLVSSTTAIHAQSGVTHRVENVLTSYFLPTAMAFTPDGRLFFTEKDTGDVRVMNVDGALQEEPVFHVTTESLGERGLIGIAVDPDFEENHFLWIFHTYPAGLAGPNVVQRIVRFKEENGVGSDPVIMLEVPYLENEAMHYGGNLHFGEDGMLYLSMGDNRNAANSQNLEVIPGKIHRFKVEGDQLVAPEDNPWENNTAFAIGLRNPFDFAFDPYSDAIFATENGAQCDDEVNLIVAGANYGWREDYGTLTNCDDTRLGELPEYTYPLVHYTPTIAPVGIEVYSGDQIPEFVGNIFFCSWKDGKMRRLALNDNRTAIVYEEEVDLRGSRCHTDIVTGPDGALYYASSQGINRLVGVDN